jgi:hypothetical protein
MWKFGLSGVPAIVSEAHDVRCLLVEVRHFACVARQEMLSSVARWPDAAQGCTLWTLALTSAGRLLGSGSAGDARSSLTARP